VYYTPTCCDHSINALGAVLKNRLMRVRSIALFLTDVGMSKLIFHASFKSTSVPSRIIYIYCVCKRIDTTAYTPSKSFIWFHFSFIVVINILNYSQATARGNEDDVNACNVCYQLSYILYERWWTDARIDWQTPLKQLALPPYGTVVSWRPATFWSFCSQNMRVPMRFFLEFGIVK